MWRGSKVHFSGNCVLRQVVRPPKAVPELGGVRCPSPAPSPPTCWSTLAPGLGTPLCFRTWFSCRWRQARSRLFFRAPGLLGACPSAASLRADAAPGTPVPRVHISPSSQCCSPWVSALGGESGRSASVLPTVDALEEVAAAALQGQQVRNRLETQGETGGWRQTRSQRSLIERLNADTEQ